MEYEHIVYVAEKETGPVLCVDRLFEDGRRDLVFEFEIPGPVEPELEMWAQFEELASTFGKSLCIDCPGLRRYMGIET